MSGNMYEWVSKTWNPLAGECPHRCLYCYVPKVIKRNNYLQAKYSGEPRLDYKALSVNLSENHVIFVSSMNDLFAESIDERIIIKVLKYTNKYPNNIYLFQTKNPMRYIEFLEMFPPKFILATTIETNRDYKLTKAPSPYARYKAMKSLRGILKKKDLEYPKLMVNIEPVMDFDLGIFIEWLKTIKPEIISIGADSKKNNLPEPEADKVRQLLWNLPKITKDVRIKNNLGRLVKD